jgi:hypothetical protein
MRPEILYTTFYGGSASTAAAPTPPVEPAATKAASPARSRATAARTGQAAEQFDVPVVSQSQVQPFDPIQEDISGRLLTQATVISDSVAVYATNSSNSRVLKMLNKGDHVLTDLSVLDSKGHWSLVKVPDERISGYVNTQDLQASRVPSR